MTNELGTTLEYLEKRSKNKQEVLKHLEDLKLHLEQSVDRDQLQQIEQKLEFISNYVKEREL